MLNLTNIVTESDYRARRADVIDLDPGTPGWTPQLHEVANLIDAMRAANLPVGNGVNKVMELYTSLDNITVEADDYFPDDVLTLNPDALAQAVRTYAQARATVDASDIRNSGMYRAKEEAKKRLHEAITRELTSTSTAAITEMGKQVDAAWAKVTAAVKAGITTATDPSKLAEEGTPEQLAAYQDFLKAAVVLSHMCGLRVKLATVGGVGANQQPALNIADGVSDINQLQGWLNTFNGTEYHVSVSPDMGGGGYGGRLPKRRSGYEWLALAENGYKVKIVSAEKAAELDGTIY